MAARYHRYLYFSLLLIILLVLFMVPIVEAEGRPGILLGLLFLVFMLRALKILSTSRPVFFAGMALAIGAISIHALSYSLHLTGASTGVGALSSAGMGAYIAFVCIVIGVLMRSIFHGYRITSDKIFAAISGYLLLGLLWAMIYWLVESFDTTSFGRPIRPWEGNITELIYFSFTTLTTLGPGDLTPNTPFASTLTYLEAVSGTLFIAILIAGLVGIIVAQSIRESPSGDK